MHTHHQTDTAQAHAENEIDSGASQSPSQLQTHSFFHLHTLFDWTPRSFRPHSTTTYVCFQIRSTKCICGDWTFTDTLFLVFLSFAILSIHINTTTATAIYSAHQILCICESFVQMIHFPNHSISIPPTTVCTVFNLTFHFLKIQWISNNFDHDVGFLSNAFYIFFPENNDSRCTRKWRVMSHQSWVSLVYFAATKITTLNLLYRWFFSFKSN